MSTGPSGRSNGGSDREIIAALGELAVETLQIVGVRITVETDDETVVIHRTGPSPDVNGSHEPRRTVRIDLRDEDGPLGHLEVQLDRPGPLDRSERLWLDRFADVVARCLRQGADRADSELVVGQLSHALESRIVIEQAKGVLAQQQQISPEEAFERMRRTARDRNVTVHAIAEQVLRRMSDQPTPRDIR